MRILAVGLIIAAIGGGATASAQSGAAPAAAIDVTAAEIQTVLKNAPPDGVSDQQIRVADIGRYNVAVGILHRSGKAVQGAISHTQVTEIYYVIAGAGTFVTGGTMTAATPAAADGTVVKILVGPSMNGTGIQNGQSRKIGPGDVIVVPPGVAHWFSAIEKDLDYLVVRVDADHVLPSGYENPLIKR
jgi:mannose-6-phosphate isomerase-like protein (cupin superfamily)